MHDCSKSFFFPENTLLAAKALSSTAADLLLTPGLKESITSDYDVHRSPSGANLLILQKTEQ